MNEIVPNKQVSFTLNGKDMTGIVVRIGQYNSTYAVVNIDTTKKREDLRWVKIEDCKIIESTH